MSASQVFAGQELDVLATQAPAGYPKAPHITSITQATGTVIVGVSPSPVTGIYPVASYQLLRAPSIAGPWTLVDFEPVSPILVATPCYDTGPTIGAESWYAATAIDTQGRISPLSTPIGYAAYSG
jgi:hypothetical protein